ncbi:MAG TPA: class I SAM-dependent methyltransferase [Acidimicrobiales bacterium]|nr:class I SAM-dependent methyltransferase [Acidimicrobiales bacterium]
MPSWRVKATLQRAFSAVPGGHRLNYLLQRHVTHGVPVSDDALRAAVEIARDHLQRIGPHSARPAADGHFFEFGAGWDLRIPQILWCLGVEQQTVVDIRPLVRPALVHDIARRLAATATGLGLPRVPSVEDPFDLERHLAALGIEYRAPCDARATGLPAGSVDRITSTNTLEHIPPAEITAIYRECRRILAPDGLVSFQIDYRDHYAGFDPSVSIYNFLRFEDATWRRYSPALHFQSRLRHREHVALVEEAGFEVLDEVTIVGDADALRALEALPLAARFRPLSKEELAVCESRLVLR